MVFEKECGDFKLTVTDPSPRWTTIAFDGQEIRGFDVNCLHDLKYLIERAIIAADRQEAEWRRDGRMR